MSALAAARQRYAEMIARREHIASPALIAALAAVPREAFLGKGPWRIKRDTSHTYLTTANADPVHLYDDVLVAIDARRRLDTGLPSLWAHFIDRLEVAPRQRVIQIGCGLGYFSAVLSHLVGPKGEVTAIECDAKLAMRAAAHLRAYPNVTVVAGDGVANLGPADVVIVHAGFAHPHPAWLAALRPRGRLLVPITQRDREGTVIRIVRRRTLFEADVLRQIRIFPGAGRGRRALDDRVADWWNRACALGPLRFRGIAQGLPADA